MAIILTGGQIAQADPDQDQGCRRGWKAWITEICLTYRDQRQEIVKGAASKLVRHTESRDTPFRKPYRRFTSHELSLIIIFSALGGALSVPIGHAGNLLKTIPGIPFGSSQALSGLHVLWLVLAATLVRKTGSGTITGVLKGLIELVLFSFHGIFVLLISTIEGMIVDTVFIISRRTNTPWIYLAGGLSSASNVAILQLLLLPRLPTVILAFMYLTSFVSGLVFGGYLSKRVLDVAGTFRC